MLGLRISALRKAAGISQSELAQLLKISPSAVGMYEQGRREPALDILADMADVFGVSIDFLVTGKAGNAQEEGQLTQLLMERVNAAEARLSCRHTRPFSREELAVLFAAMLMEP